MDVRYKTRRNRKTEKVRGGRSGVQLLISLVVFVGVIFCKLVFPGGASALREKLLPLISESVDYEAALTAAGKLLGGDAQALEDVAANILPHNDEDVQPAAVPDLQTPDGERAMFSQATRMAAWTQLNAGRAEIVTQLATLVELQAEAVTEPDTEPETEPEVNPAVAAFLESQAAFSDLETPENVNLDTIISYKQGNNVHHFLDDYDKR